MAPPTLFNSEIIAKGQLYARFKQLLLEAGWTNVSSNPVTDYDVFYSKGESGTGDLYFQFRDIHYNGAAPTTTLTTNTFASCRMCGKYTPGTPGVSGTFQFPPAVYSWFIVAWHNSGSLDPSTPMRLFYHVNKNRIIFITDLLNPTPTGTGGSVNFIGLSDFDYANDFGSMGVLYAASTNVLGYNNYAFFTQHPYYDTYQLALTTFVGSPKAPNSSGRFSISEMYVYDSVAGVHTKLDGLYAMTASAGYLPFNGDLLIDKDGYVYKIIITAAAAGTQSTFQNTYVTFRVQ